MIQKSSRLIEVDVVRGLAILGVVLFHIVWDLEFAGIVSGLAFHPIWLGFGRVLAGTFMFLVGVSLVLAHSKSFKKRAFLKRLAIVASASLLISIVTWFAFPNSFIFYGILHAIAVSSLVGLLFLRLPQAIVLIAAVITVSLPNFVSLSFFDTRWLAWIGLYSTPPTSNDFVPFFPWVGITLLGIVFARAANLPNRVSLLPIKIGSNPTVTLIAWMGKKSLPIYLIHQPVLLAIIVPLAWLFVA